MAAADDRAGTRELQRNNGRMALEKANKALAGSFQGQQREGSIMPQAEGNERLARLEARVDNIQNAFGKHEDNCEDFRGEMREAIVSVKTSLAKYSGLAVLIMAGVVALVQIVIERVLK